MRTKRRTELVFERDRTIVYSGRYPRPRLWCIRCATEVEMITVFEAARLTRSSADTIIHEAEQGMLHLEKTNSGVLVVCLASIADWAPRFTSAAGPTGPTL